MKATELVDFSLVVILNKQDSSQHGFFLLNSQHGLEITIQIQLTQAPGFVHFILPIALFQQACVE
jgi:hypothetical protein